MSRLSPLADRVRAFANHAILQPARARGETVVQIRVGTVHQDMGLHQRWAAVSAALGADRFTREFLVRRLTIEGPLNGANCVMTFELL